MTTSYTECTIRSGGNNLNAGTTLGVGEEATAPLKTYSNGSNVAGVFTVASGNPVTDGITVGMFASMYIDGGAPPTATPYLARVSGVSSTTITLAAGAAVGVIPANGANRTLRIGGAWAGPNTTDQAFPLALANLNNLTTVTTTFPPRINFKNDQTYTVSALTTSAINGPLTMQGYTTTFGDGGRATLTGGTSGASFNLISFTGINPAELRDFIFKNNGATGSAHGIVSAGRNYCRNCIFTGMLGAGLNNTSLNIGAVSTLEECEIYGNNTSNTASFGGIVLVSQMALVRCFVHDNAGSNSSGIVVTSSVNLVCKNCIFSGNGSHAINMAGQGMVLATECDFYNNGGSGITFTVASQNLIAVIENSNFIKNGAWAINLNTNTGTQARVGSIVNCGFGVGTQANTSGNINTASDGIGNMQEIGSVNYASGVTPWNDPANGDFSITLAAAQNAGRMAFIETSVSLSAPNTTGVIDIGAAQHGTIAGRFVSAQRGTPY